MATATVGVGQNAERFPDELTDLMQNDRRPFVNLVASV